MTTWDSRARQTARYGFMQDFINMSFAIGCKMSCISTLCDIHSPKLELMIAGNYIPEEEEFYAMCSSMGFGKKDINQLMKKYTESLLFIRKALSRQEYLDDFDE